MENQSILSIFNIAESFLWFAFAVIVFIGSKSNDDFRNIRILLTIGFFAFGISDIIESYTGTWWEPIELLILKAGCVALFIYCYFRYMKDKKKAE